MFIEGNMLKTPIVKSCLAFWCHICRYECSFLKEFHQLHWREVTFNTKLLNSFINSWNNAYCPSVKSHFLRKMLCSTQKVITNWFGSTWVLINNDPIFLFGWTFPSTLVLAAQMLNAAFLSSLSLLESLWYSVFQVFPSGHLTSLFKAFLGEVLGRKKSMWLKEAWKLS